jgi:hypothetical protein
MLTNHGMGETNSRDSQRSSEFLSVLSLRAQFPFPIQELPSSSAWGQDAETISVAYPKGEAVLYRLIRCPHCNGLNESQLKILRSAGGREVKTETSETLLESNRSVTETCHTYALKANEVPIPTGFMVPQDALAPILSSFFSPIAECSVVEANYVLNGPNVLHRDLLLFKSADEWVTHSGIMNVDKSFRFVRSKLGFDSVWDFSLEDLLRRFDGVGSINVFRKISDI